MAVFAEYRGLNDISKGGDSGPLRAPACEASSRHLTDQLQLLTGSQHGHRDRVRRLEATSALTNLRQVGRAVDRDALDGEDDVAPRRPAADRRRSPS